MCLKDPTLSTMISQDSTRPSELDELYLARLPEVRKLELIARSSRGATSILDLGAGAGIYLPYMRRYFTTVVAVDLSPVMCNEVCQQGFEVVQGDMEHLPFRDAAFDVLFGSEVLEHASSLEAMEAALSEIERVAAKTILLTVPNP